MEKKFENYENEKQDFINEIEKLRAGDHL